ncbi:PREDICTED: protein ROOT PRIMORDIUM DEFECTIVE 1 [Theobroma cacao]|uniref:Protein ROOT PRIMORDIUM DEFECTIVE 1 n=1 Tax=Theobroma cacao TaxID=3641 RepID=A0AB32UVR7_THECC|nr:PREDICTED: protein ROOT PRIMORDIUM DEFECTIVE 1 [Theobroma cacao]
MVMAWRFFFLGIPLLNPNPKFPNPCSFSTSFLITKTPKKHKPKRPKPDSPRTRPVTPDSNKIPQFESLLDRDATFRFLTKTKEFLSKQSEQILPLDDAGKLHRELGFPRGRKVARSIARHPLLVTTYRHSDNKIWLGFTDLMDQLLLEEKSIMEAVEEDRVTKICKLLMMSKNKRIPLSKIYHKRLIFGIPEDFRDKIGKYTDYFRLVIEDDGKQVLELVNWDPSLAVSALEKEFLVNEDKVKKAFKFPVKYGKDLGLEENDVKKLNLLNTLPLVSPYSDGWKLDLWSLEAEKYRVGIIHEFLSLTLEKRALIHHIVEFKEEFSLTRQTYEMLKRQPWTFYLAGTEMNWAVFLKDGYDENGNLIEKDPQVLFNEKLYKFAQMQDEELSSEFGEK